MKIRKSNEKKLKSDLLPLMDCMFILLIYFIFSMLDMTNYPGIKVNTPKAHTSEKASDPFNVLTIKNKQIYLNKELIPLEKLESKLQEVTLADMTATGKKLYISADENEKTHDVFKVLEELRKIGEEKIYIETVKK